MDQGQKQQLGELKQQVIQSMVPLLDDAQMDPADRFDIVFKLAEAQGNPAYYHKAYELTHQLQGDAKLQALMSLLESLDGEIQYDEQEPQGTDTTAVSQ